MEREISKRPLIFVYKTLLFRFAEMFRFYRKEVYFSTKQSFAFCTKEHNLLKRQAMKNNIQTLTSDEKIKEKIVCK